MILGVFGPWQILAILFILIVIAGIVLLIVLLSNRANQKSRAATLDTTMRNAKSNPDAKYDQLEKLNKLKESGALTEEEFEAEKKKVLG